MNDTIISWDFIWSYIMQSSAARSWLFQMDSPPNAQIVSSLQHCPLFFRCDSILPGSNQVIMNRSVTEFHAPFSNVEGDQDIVLGFSIGLDGDSSTLKMLSFIDQSEPLSTQLAVRRAVWRRYQDETGFMYFLFLEFGWFNSGKLYATAKTMPAVADSTKNKTRLTFCNYVHVRVFSLNSALILQRTSEMIDEIINERSSDEQVPCHDISCLFNPPFETNNYIFDMALKGNEEKLTKNRQEFSGTTAFHKLLINEIKNYSLDITRIPRMWLQVIEEAFRSKKIGKGSVSIFQKPFGKNANVVNRMGNNSAMPFHFAVEHAIDHHVTGRFRQLCNVLRIKTESPRTDAILMGDFEELEHNGIGICVKHISNEESDCKSVYLDQFQVERNSFFGQKFKNSNKGLYQVEDVKHQRREYDERMIDVANDLCVQTPTMPKVQEEHSAASFEISPDLEKSKRKNTTGERGSSLAEEQDNTITPLKNTPSNNYESLRSVKSGDVTFWECHHCNKKFREKRGNLIRHINNVHTKEISFICSESGCNRRFQSHCNLRRHVMTIHKGKSFGCNLCSRRFKTCDSLKAHLKSVHTNSKKVCSCNECGGNFSTASTLDHHKKQHEKNQQRRKW